MGYAVLVENSVAVVRLTNHLAIHEIEASRRQAAELASRENLNGILVDLSQATSPLTTMDIYQICSGHHEVLLLGVRVAIVIPPQLVKARDARFAETVCANRGVLLRSFRELEAAKQWLARKDGA